MPQLRLIGLVLFITTAFLAMAAATTQTTHIRFKKPSGDASEGILPDWQSVSPQLPLGPDRELSADSSTVANSGPLQFIAIPVVYPLAIAAGLGLLLWFVPAPLMAPKPASKRRRRKRK